MKNRKENLRKQIGQYLQSVIEGYASAAHMSPMLAEAEVFAAVDDIVRQRGTTNPGDAPRNGPSAGSASLFVQHERWTADRWKVMFQVGMLKFSIGAECSDKQQAELLRDDFTDALSQLGINLPNDLNEHRGE